MLQEDKIRIIVKVFHTEKESEEYQWELYDKYDHVMLIRKPFFGSGQYVWEVR